MNGPTVLIGLAQRKINGLFADDAARMPIFVGHDYLPDAATTFITTSSN
jgi:hypothetical protein